MKTKFKVCSKCKKEKELFEFYKDKSKPDAHRPDCKICVNIKVKKYRNNNKEKYKKYHKNYYIMYREKIIKIQKQYELKNLIKRQKYHEEYRKNNKKIINKRIRKWQKIQLNNNLNFRILNNLRRRLNLALNRNIKSVSTMFLIGCEIDYLMYHLQEQFTKGMSWDNYGIGGWEIDHIKPCASFDFSDPKQQIKCFNYKNLQPLWAIDNKLKGNKLW